MSIFFMFLGLFALVFLNVPIAVALGVVSAVAMVTVQGPDMLPNVALVMFDGATKFPLIAIPLFIFAGAIMNAGGISRRLIAFASALLGFVKGGLSMVTIGASMFFAEISGSAVAGVAALGSILIPAMKSKGYPLPFATAVSSSAATLAIVLPPSIPMIIYAVMAQTSIVQLFVAGFVPGLMGGFSMMALCYWFARKHNYPVEEKFQAARVWATFKDGWLAFTLPVIILGGIFGGFVTATEGAGLAVVASLIIGVIYNELDLPRLKKALIDGGVQTAAVMVLVAASALVGVFLTEEQVPQELAAKIGELTQNKYLILLLLNVFFLIVGLFLHSAAAIILVVPIVMPLVNLMGIDPVHFGLIVTLNLAIGQQTPPVASVLVTACSVGGADVWEVTKVNVYFIAVLTVVLLLVTYIPALPMAPVEFFYR
ncbi:MAG: TRAP transporter large permease [Rhodospirillales bacterium]|nr:TRAP transporter large permease [Rhodospirillales bacterium]